MNQNPLRDEEMIRNLILLKENDPDGFADLFVSIIKQYPDLAEQDDAPIESKVKALSRILENQEAREKYEDCAFIVQLQKKIEDGGKD